MKLTLLFVLLGVVWSQVPPAVAEDEEVMSGNYFYNSNDEDFEGSWFTQSTPEEKPVVFFIEDPFDKHSEKASNFIMELVSAGYSVATVDLGKFRNRRAFNNALKRDTEDMVSRVSAAFRFLSDSFPFEYKQRALIGYGLGGTVALEVVRFGAMDGQAVTAITPTALKVSKGKFDESVNIQLLVGEPGRFTTLEIVEFERELGLAGPRYEVTRFSTAGDDILADERSWARARFLIKGFLSVAFNPDQLDYLSEPYDVTNVDNGQIAFDDVDYSDDGLALRGFVAYPRGVRGPLPLVIIAPDWDGLDGYEKWRAKLVAQMGYVALAADVYGANVRQGSALPFFRRTALTALTTGPVYVSRMRAAIRAAADSDLFEVDPNAIAVVGYCSGASGSLEVARAQLPGVRAVVIFHAWGMNPLTPPTNGCQNVAVLIHNGADDLSSPPLDIEGFFQSNGALNVLFEFTNYGKTVHAFTIPFAPSGGLQARYEPYSDVRSFDSLEDYLKRIFADNSLYNQC